MIQDPLREMRERLETDRQLRLVHRAPDDQVAREKPYTYYNPVPVDLWIKCPSCGTIASREIFEQNGSVCKHCSHHYRLDSLSRLNMICDPDSFTAWDTDVNSVNPIQFAGYLDKIRQLQEKTGLTEAIVTGQTTIEGQLCAIGVMDSRFMMGSMGSAVGEKIARLFDRAGDLKLPVVLFIASGGARMQEGIVSLMQMAKTAAAVARFQEHGLLYCAVLTDPTTGGVTASFASMADIMIAEPGTLIGFAGRRVIEGTLTDSLPEGFQRAEFLLEHGFLDMIVPRSDLRPKIASLIRLHHKRDCPVSFSRPRSVNSRDDQTVQLSLTAAERLALIRHRKRPVLTDYLPLLFDDLIELHGDRCFSDDPALWCGLGRINGLPVTIVGHRKGRNLEENAQCHFGMPHPEGYRKALRLMKQAEKFGRPILTFIDTPGAYCGIGAEERGQSAAIADCLIGMIQLKVPVITLVTGEGGSGGALAIGVGDRLGMLSNALYSVISPRGFASLLWKDPTREQEAANVMKITAEDLIRLGICDELVAEPPEGAHTDPAATVAAIRRFFASSLEDLHGMDPEELNEERVKRFRSYGFFSE